MIYKAYSVFQNVGLEHILEQTYKKMTSSKPWKPCTPLGTRTLDTLIKSKNTCIIIH